MSRFVQEAKNFIMDSFAEERPTVGQKIFIRRLMVPISKLHPPVKDALPQAMKELQQEGLFDNDEGLTEKGVDYIYGDLDSRTQEARTDILNQLRDMQARVGYSPNWRAFITASEPYKNALVAAVKELQSEGVLDESEALTEKGYESLY
ncbi:hypothetical protein [Maridesulfovibrio sp.]|uniref:hypothetical protein n=1 Tax=Maridesulfovibrio sp. TaxID=2795000 RepID=UPI002A18E7BD|nr:hypothetical protein [Maridesulfovibrio sp.]